MGGPTTDYAINPFREGAKAAAFDGTTATYTFTNAIPANATGTWAFSLEARRTITLSPAPSDTPTVNESAFNPVFYAAVTDAQAAPRRRSWSLPTAISATTRSCCTGACAGTPRCA